MAKKSAKSVIDKATTDKPVWFDIDPDQKGKLVIQHKKTLKTIKTWGWTLNEVLSLLGWRRNDIRAIFKRPWSQSVGASDVSPGVLPKVDLTKLQVRSE